MKKLLIVCSVLFLVSCSAVGVKPENGSGPNDHAKKHQGHKGHAGHKGHEGYKGHGDHKGHGKHKGKSCHHKHGGHGDHKGHEGHKKHGGHGNHQGHEGHKGYGKHKGKSCHQKHGGHLGHGDAKGHGKHQSHARRQGHGKYFATIAYIKHHLTLDKAQKSQLDALMKKMKENNKVAHDQIKLVSKELHDAIKSKANDRVLTQVLNKKAAIRTQLELQNIHTRQAVMGLLTKEQRQKVMKKLHAHHTKH